MPGPLTPDQKRQAQELALKHHSLRAIARELQSTVPTVKRAIAEAQEPKTWDRRPDDFQAPEQWKPKLLYLPLSWFGPLKKLARQNGMTSLAEYLRYCVRKELEAAGAVKH